MILKHSKISRCYPRHLLTTRLMNLANGFESSSSDLANGNSVGHMQFTSIRWDILVVRCYTYYYWVPKDSMEWELFLALIHKWAPMTFGHEFVYSLSATCHCT